MIEKFRVGMVKNGCSHSGYKSLKLDVSQEEMILIKWFFACWYKFRKAKSYLNNFEVVMVRNGCGLSGHGTLKSGISLERLDELGWFFTCR